MLREAHGPVLHRGRDRIFSYLQPKSIIRSPSSCRLRATEPWSGGRTALPAPAPSWLRKVWACGQADGLFTAFWKLCILSSLFLEPETILLSLQLASGPGPGHPTDTDAARLIEWEAEVQGLEPPALSLLSILSLVFPLSPLGTVNTLQLQDPRLFRTSCILVII